jgi:imidazolonepropionase-like amidohydrolase
MELQKLTLRRLILCAAAFFLVVSASSAQLAITHVTVIDGSGRVQQPEQTILIEKGRIAAVGPVALVKLPSHGQIIDGSGKYAIPGLWDMHVHLAGVSADPAWSKQVLLPLLLANGITGVRDMGGDLEILATWRRETESGALIGPRIIASGPWLAGGGKKTSEQFPVANAEEARAAVRELRRRGADFIKVIALPSRDAFFAAADEAKKENIPFAGHLPVEISALEASNAGIRSIEHLYYSAFALSCSSKEDELRKSLTEKGKRGAAGIWNEILLEAEATYDPEKAKALWRVLQKNNTWLTPTLASLDITAHPENDRPEDPLLAFVPHKLAKEWRDSLGDQDLKKRAASLWSVAANDWKLTGEMHQAGVALLAGSDSLDPFVFPGDSLHRELAELVRAGFTPAEALRAATLGAAEFLGRQHELGTIEKGNIADLVLLDANPLEDIGNTRKISVVIRSGKYLDRAALDKLLAEAKSAAAAVQ